MDGKRSKPRITRCGLCMFTDRNPPHPKDMAFCLQHERFVGPDDGCTFGKEPPDVGRALERIKAELRSKETYDGEDEG